MEHWIGIALFLFLFVILPLLQQLAQRRRGSQEEPELDDWEAEAPEGARRRRRIEPEEWGAGGAATPPPDAEPVAAERSAWEDLGLDDLFREPQPRPREEPRPSPS